MSRGPDSLASDDPARKVPAIVAAGRDGSVESVPRLIELLQSPDPGIRFFAIASLQRITGQTHGYRYFDPEHTRAEAVARWRADPRWSTDPLRAPGPVQPGGQSSPDDARLPDDPCLPGDPCSPDARCGVAGAGLAGPQPGREQGGVQ